jgi:PEGA domain
VIKGEGAYAGDVTSGPHTIVVSREGYERFEKSVNLGPNETSADTVTLKPVAAAGGIVKEGEHGYQGVYGGFGLLFMDSTSQGTELDTNCDTLGAQSCASASPIGGGGFGYVGYTWDPVGFELMVGGGGDAMQEKATFSNQTKVGAMLPMASPGRTETFSFIRGGGLGALRARVAFQTSWIRGTIAGGVGVSYHEVIAKREAKGNDGSDISYVPDPVGYLSPALSMEAAAHFRVTQTLAISVGLEVWADSASIAGKNASTGGPLQPFDVAQPPPASYQYHLATGPQVMLGPFLGMQFGP